MWGVPPQAISHKTKHNLSGTQLELLVLLPSWHFENRSIIQHWAIFSRQSYWAKQWAVQAWYVGILLILLGAYPAIWCGHQVALSYGVALYCPLCKGSWGLTVDGVSFHPSNKCEGKICGGWLALEQSGYLSHIGSWSSSRKKSVGPPFSLEEHSLCPKILNTYDAGNCLPENHHKATSYFM